MAKNATMSVHAMVKALPQYAGVLDARLWQDRRIYIETVKSNGGQKWNGGRGYRTLFIDLESNRLYASGEAGSKTRKALRPTLECIAVDFGLNLIVRS